MTDRRAAIYARYSTDHQNDRSIEDQIALCRDHAARSGAAIVATYEDRARTSASLIGRDGITDLVADARAGRFDVVIVESLDRISRDQEDLAGVFKRLSHYRVKIEAVHDGVADAVQVGLRGLIGSIFLKDLKEKTRRGMAGVVRDGRSAGGRAYGYRPVPGRPGELSIEPAEAAVVTRIFADYVGGVSPREIASRLNREAVPPPRGSRWNASTINGNATRGYGILLNPLYRGEIVWNRVAMTRDPDTGRRVSRVNPESEWQRKEAPELRIVPADLADAVLARKLGRGPNGPIKARSKRLLSGLLRCGTCGGAMVTSGKVRGRPQIICSASKESGTCPNGRRTFVDLVEHTVIRGLREQLSDPAAMARYIETFNAKRNRDADQATRDRTRAERRLAEIKREIGRIVDAIVAGSITHDDARDRMTVLRQEQTRTENAIARAAAEAEVVALHPKALEAYQRDLFFLSRQLEAVLDDNDKARTAFHALVESVVVSIQGRYEPPLVEVRGRLAALLGADLAPNVALGLVAGGRSDRESNISGAVVSIGTWIATRAA